MRSRRSITPDVVLVGDLDVEQRFENVPSYFSAKGMFFSRLRELGGDEVWARLAPQLQKPPAQDRYLPFADYPQEDLFRLTHAVAVATQPRCEVPEAMRRVARGDFETFVASKLGAVVFALTGDDVREALLKLPAMYAMTLKGGEVTARADGDVVTLQFQDFHGWLDCHPVGQVEGLLAHHGARAVIELDLAGETSGRYLVRLVR